MMFCKVLLCSAALVLLAGSVESSSGGSTGDFRFDLSGSALTDLYNKRVHLAEAMRRPLGNLPVTLGIVSHCGVRVTLADGSRWLIHKGGGYGISSQTVVTDARHMSSNWRVSSKHTKHLRYNSATKCSVVVEDHTQASAFPEDR